MANAYANKVVFGGRTVIDLTGDTVTADKLLSGYTAHAMDGSPIIGTVDYNEKTDVTVSNNTITVPAGLWLNDVHVHMTGWEWDNLVFTNRDVITEGATGYSVD